MLVKVRNRSIISSFAVLAAVFLLMASCSKPAGPLQPEQKKQGKSDDTGIQYFSILRTYYPSLTKDINAYINGESIRFSIPEDMDPSSIKLVIVTSKATVTIDGKEYKAGEAYDLSNSAIVNVVSESGRSTRIYRTQWERGDNFIDSYVWKLMDECNIPGVSLSVMKGTEMAYSKAYGWAVKNSEKATPNTLFRMASISKQFCTMCIMKLKEDGKLTLDDKVFGKFGILKGRFRTTAYHESITVRHLLSHSSGISTGLEDPAFTSSYRFFQSNSSNPVPTDTLIQRTLDRRPGAYTSGSVSYSPGCYYSYSNVGYCILHRIVEVVSGKDYETYLKEDVLKPMGVTDTHIGGYQNERRPNESVVYSQGGGNGYLNPLRTIAGAAGIITSSEQLMKILTYMDGDDTVPDIFTEQTLKEMYTPYAYSREPSRKTYGLGWRMNNGKRFFGSHFHGGNMAGTATMWVGGAVGDALGTYPEPMSGAILCNSRSYNSKINWTTSWGASYPNDIDDSFYIILGEAFRYFK